MLLIINRKERWQKHFLQWFSSPKLTDELRNTWLGYWSQVDESLAADLKEKLSDMMRMEKGKMAPAGDAGVTKS